MKTVPSSPSRFRAGIPLVALLVPVLAALAGSCGSGGGGGGSGDIPGQERPKPGGGTYFVDPNQGGEATRLHLVEVFWGRLVDVHDVDANGVQQLQPVFRDFTINENVQSDGSNYRIETNPITQKTRLVILRQRGAPDTGSGTFDSLLSQASQGLPPITPKNDDGTSPGPFSFAARNSTLMLRFDDVLSDDEEAELNLVETVRVLTGYPPRTPFSARVLFDPNHGSVVRGAFHSTRVLIDLTVSEAESAGMAVPAPLNSLGLPPSLTTENTPNASLRLPTRTFPGAGQFAILRGLSGVPLSVQENGPVDLGSPTQDVVRALRAGNPADLNNGFLLDLNAPEIVGGWPLRIESVDPDPQGQDGFDFLIGATFSTVCRGAPRVGAVLNIGDSFLEVVQDGAPPDPDGAILDVRARLLADDPVTETAALLGNGLFLSTFDPDEPVPGGCWVSFTPQPGGFPATGVSTMSEVLVRFSEPMDPASLTPFDTFMIIRGDANTVVIATNIVVGTVNGTSDLKSFTLLPTLPFMHVAGVMDPYNVRIEGPTDLAGNDLRDPLPPVNFTLDPALPEEVNGSTVVRFNDTDEIPPIGFQDLRGQFFLDLDRGVINPRPVAIDSFPADRGNPVPSIMIPFPPGVQTPLTPLGSKLQTVWRYCDLGWQVLDETKFNMDVIGLAWAPIGGQVLSDFYEEFEIRLSHSRRLPDEAINAALLPDHPSSGLVGGPSFFTDNILNDPLSPQKVVHQRSKGYLINPADLFLASSGTIMLPYPLNRGPGSPVTYTWRDTAVLGKAGPLGVGIPLDIEVGPPIGLENREGYVAQEGQVPSFGLPLLMEYRCYPSDSGIGLNPLDISLAVNSSATPSFRSYSSGGINTVGRPVVKNPDLELVPSGGFNPTSTPPGRRTMRSDDNSFYIGQLDAVTRISRVHTVWIDTVMAAPNFSEPIVLPRATDQPFGTQIVVDFRGATGFSADILAVSAPFDATQLNPYGELFRIDANGDFQTFGTVSFLGGVATWRNGIDALDGARYLQLRITFLNNIETGLNPELSAIGIAYSGS